jgi:prepilin peptidase CpaA
MFYAPLMDMLPFTLPPLFFAVGLSALMLAVIRFDALHYLIPNSLNMAIFMLYLPAIYFLKLDAVSGLMAAGVILLVGLGIFALGLMGGGDIKLLTALGLWFGFSETLAIFLILTTLLGGVLSLLALLARAIIGRVWLKYAPETTLPRVLTKGQPVPYGIAIATAFLLLLWRGEVFAL